MIRNLDITTLRSFVAVAECQGITKAASFLNLTQSAVSMQIKRMEDTLGLKVLDRSARQVALTGQGEQLLSYARRIVALNDEAVSLLSEHTHEGELVLGVPSDIIYPVVPQVLRQFCANFPKVRTLILSQNTFELKEAFAAGDCDVILTTESATAPGGIRVATAPLRWVGAVDGHCWQTRPLRLAQGQRCSFRPVAMNALREAGIAWRMVIDTPSDLSVAATVSADLAVTAMMEPNIPAHMSAIPAGTLPDLGEQHVNMYVNASRAPALVPHFTDALKAGFAAM